VNRFVIGNETNLGIERPNGAVITAADFAECFNMARRAIKEVRASAQIAPGAPGPWNLETGDPIVYFSELLRLVECDAICVHAYSRGYDIAAIHSEERQHGWYWSFKCYRDFMEAVPVAKRHLPCWLTEANGDGPWPDHAFGWMEAAHNEIQWWNQQPQNQTIQCVVLYRYQNHDQWQMEQRPGVLDAFRRLARLGMPSPAPRQVAQPQPVSQPTPQPQPKPQPTMGQISDNLISTVARVLRVEQRAMQAILAIESGGAAFRDGRPVIRFEPHVFWNLWGKDNPDAFHANFQFENWRGDTHRRRGPSDEWLKMHGSQDDEWAALEQASALNRELAIQSASLGAPQIMGFNHIKCGYPNAVEMLAAFSASATPQIWAFASFIANSPGCLEAMQAGDWLKFATIYNGPGQAERYAALIRGRLQQ
jgi:hypothetical protein